MQIVLTSQINFCEPTILLIYVFTLSVPLSYVDPPPPPRRLPLHALLLLLLLPLPGHGRNKRKEQKFGLLFRSTGEKGSERHIIVY